MKIGLRVAHQRHDPAYMAFRIGDLAHHFGYDAEILPLGKIGTVHPSWDRNVIRDGKIDFFSWIKTGMHALVYFGEPGSIEEIVAAKKANLKTIFVCLWEQVAEEDGELMPIFDTVVCPSRKTAQVLMDRYKLENLKVIPWDTGLPITKDKHDIDPDRLGIIWPLDGSQCMNQEPRFIPVIQTIISKCPNVCLTITYSNVLPQQGVKSLRQLVQDGDGRVELIRNTTWDKHALLYGHHDLTVWPSLIESVGYVGLCSLAMCTPVLAFDHPIIGEIIKDGKNGELVSCELQLNWLGVPYVQADYNLFSKQLLEIINNPSKLRSLRESTTTGLKERSLQFIDKWNTLLELE